MNESLLLLFGFIVLIVSGVLQFFYYKLKRYGIQGDVSGMRRLQWFQYRFIAFLYLGTALLFILFIIE